jgi:hypothetical protein
MRAAARWQQQDHEGFSSREGKASYKLQILHELIMDWPAGTPARKRAAAADRR